MRKTKQSGFTLVEMSVVVLILGLITGAFFTFLKQKREQDAYNITVERQQKIATALSEYVQLRNRLPCPGRPNPPGGSEVLGDPRTNNNCNGGLNLRIGIVPFRALGLSIDDARDGYGNPFTYVVDRDAAHPAGVTSATVHVTCLKSGVWMDGAINRNPQKAVFCCQFANSALTVEYKDDSGTKTSVITPQSSTNWTGDDLYTPYPSPTTTQDTAYIAYILISHGANGEEAFTFGNTARRSRVSASDDEHVNADSGTSNFLIKAKSTAPGNDYFDDIILWRTQQRMMTELNSNTCAIP